MPTAQQAPPGVLRSAVLGAWRELVATAHPEDATTRALTLATATTCLGTGVFYSVSALFFSRVVGLSAAQIGLGLAVAGAVGAVSTLAAGRIAATIGSRRALVGSLVLLGAGTAAYTLAGNMLVFVLLASAVSAFRFASNTARVSLIATIYTGHERVRLRARMRVITNVSIGAGGLCGGIALAVGTPAAFRVTLLVVGVLIGLSAVPLLSSAARAGTAADTAGGAGPGQRAGTPPRSPLRDWRYLGIAATISFNTVYLALVEVGVPLWLAQHTTAPDILVSFLLATNTVVVVLTQIPAASGTHDVVRAGFAALRAAALLVTACAAFAVAGWLAALPASILLFAGVLLMSGGEVWGEAGSWGLTMELADPRNQPRYQAVTQMAYAIGQTVGPLIISVTALAHGTWGWAVLAAMFGLAGISLFLLSRPGNRVFAAQ